MVSLGRAVTAFVLGLILIFQIASFGVTNTPILTPEAYAQNQLSNEQIIAKYCAADPYDICKQRLEPTLRGCGSSEACKEQVVKVLDVLAHLGLDLSLKTPYNAEIANAGMWGSKGPVYANYPGDEAAKKSIKSCSVMTENAGTSYSVGIQSRVDATSWYTERAAYLAGTLKDQLGQLKADKGWVKNYSSSDYSATVWVGNWAGSDPTWAHWPGSSDAAIETCPQQYALIGRAAGIFACGTAIASAERQIQSQPAGMPKFKDGANSKEYVEWSKERTKEAEALALTAVEETNKLFASFANDLCSEAECQCVGPNCPVLQSQENAETFAAPITPAAYAQSWKLLETTTKVETFDLDPWKFNYKIVNGEGLVLTKITARNELLFESVSVPYFKIEYDSGKKSEVVQYCKGIDRTTELHIDSAPKFGVDVLRWSFEKNFNQKDLKGKLTINYDIFIRWYKRNNCETFSFECYKFIPRISFSWIDKSQEKSQPTLDRFTAYYRLDYGKVGFTLTKASDWLIGQRLYNAGRQPILTHEIKFNAIKDGKPGDYDDIHMAHPGQGVNIPGCRPTLFDCVHIHWKWPKGGGGVIGQGARLEPYYSGGSLPTIDPLSEPTTDAKIDASLAGTPYLVPGQTIDIAITRYNEKESINPESFSSVYDPILSFADDHQPIATVMKYFPKLNPRVNEAGDPIEEEDLYTLGSAEHVIVVWYVTSAKNKSTDTFFRHGVFVLDRPTVDTSKPLIGTVRGGVDEVRGLLAVKMGSEADAMTKILGHLNESLRDEYWLPDNNTLVPEKGERLFAELSQAANIMREVRNEKPNLSEVIDEATFGLLFATRNSVYSTIWNEVDRLKAESLADESTLESLFTKNESLSLSVKHYSTAVHESDLNNAVQIVDNLKESWKNAIKGIREVSSELANVAPRPTLPLPTPGAGQPPITGPPVILPKPPFGQPEPDKSVQRMTLQVGQLRVKSGQTANLPIWLVKSNNVANMNFEVTYDQKVVMPEGKIENGSLLRDKLLTTNAKQTGTIFAGFAATTGVSNTGTLLTVPFRAVGKPGESTQVQVTITAINDPSGNTLTVDQIHGEIMILREGEGMTTGDCDGDGRLTAKDAYYALDVSVGLLALDMCVDMDNNGQVTSRDAVLILQKSVGKS